jgi:FMN phosphatase YigB (HAD superfamily)
MAGTEVKVLALDIFGTVLSSRKSGLPARKGIDSLIEKCRGKKIKIVSISDCSHIILAQSFKESNIDPSFFNASYQLHAPKDMRDVLEAYKIKPNQLLVVGDSYERDIDLAKQQGCKTFLVPEYQYANEWDISEVLE